MSFEIRSTPRGHNALWQGKLLHSAYDANREAEAWATRVNASPGSLVFVAGDPWGLASSILQSRGCRAAALLPGPEALPLVPEGVRAWAPGSKTLEGFLDDVFAEEGPDAVIWEVWPAFERLAPEITLDWGRRFRDLYRTVQGSWLTNRRFGPRFWTNAVRNAVDWNRPVQLLPGQRPIVIAASGPSLDDGLDLLARDRRWFDLWALPSSFETLVQRGLLPDAGVATDGGFYAREHLQRLSGKGVPLLAALSSAPDSVLAQGPTLFFSQGLPVERALLGALLPRVPEVPSQGTVAVTALRLALEATSGPVLIAGLDLSFRDLRGHTSPHTVDRRIVPQLGRLNPGEGVWAQRWVEQATVEVDGVRTSQALLTYAGWFRTRARFARTVHRVSPSPLHWSSMNEVDWQGAAALWRSAPGQGVGLRSTTGAPREERLAKVRSALNDLTRAVAAPECPTSWLTEVCRTAVPEALAEDWRAARRGLTGRRAPEALAAFLADLTKELR